jgi:hypothetical protein
MRICSEASRKILSHFAVAIPIAVSTSFYLCGLHIVRETATPEKRGQTAMWCFLLGASSNLSFYVIKCLALDIVISNIHYPNSYNHL